MRIVRCEYDPHAPAILAVFNDAILGSTALYEYEPRTLGTMAEWFEAKTRGGYPVFGAESEDGELMGFASYGPFRDRPAYQYSVEHSVYVDARFRGHGVGKALLREIIEAAVVQGYHTLVAGIDTANIASIALHENLGFTHCGTVRHAGWKFDRWLDLAFYQMIPLGTTGGDMSHEEH